MSGNKPMFPSSSSHLQSDEEYFGSTFSWIDATHVKQDDYVVLDTVRDNNSNEDKSKEDLIDPEIEEELVAKQKANKGNKKHQVAAGQPGRKLRPAADMLSRLRWDPAFDSGDYIIGYEDRFLGEMEIPLESWKVDQTHEDFIPMHRILYFKKKTGGDIVWDRRTRKDDIFGSGASGG